MYNSSQTPFRRGDIEGVSAQKRILCHPTWCIFRVPETDGFTCRVLGLKFQKHLTDLDSVALICGLLQSSPSGKLGQQIRLDHLNVAHLKHPLSHGLLELAVLCGQSFKTVAKDLLRRGPALGLVLLDGAMDFLGEFLDALGPRVNPVDSLV